MKPGIYDIPYQEYHDIDAVRGSYLKALNNCPGDSKFLEEGDETKEQRIGKAAHTLTLEPEKFNNEWVVTGHCEKELSSGRRQGEACGKAGKYLYKDVWLCGQHGSTSDDPRDFLLNKEYEIIERIAGNMKAHPTISEAMSQGESEITLVWKDEETGILCKARPDRRTKIGTERFLLNLKTCQSTDEFKFRSHANKMGYDMGAGMQIEGLRAITGDQNIVDAYGFVAAEKKRACRIELHEMDPDWIDWGIREFHRLLRIEAECRKNDCWPAWQNPGATLLTKPPWLDGGL